MSRITPPKNNSLFVLSHNHFIILFLTLFSLLFVFSGAVFSSEIYIAYQRKFVVPLMEKKFGFRAGRQKVVETDKYESFVVETVEPGGLFEQAGFKPGDMPIFYGCRFFWINKSSESGFFERLSYLRDDGVGVFNVLNIDDFRKNGDRFIDDRKLFLITQLEPCDSPR